VADGVRQGSKLGLPMSMEPVRALDLSTDGTAFNSPKVAQ